MDSRGSETRRTTSRAVRNIYRDSADLGSVGSDTTVGILAPTKALADGPPKPTSAPLLPPGIGSYVPVGDTTVPACLRECVRALCRQIGEEMDDG